MTQNVRMFPPPSKAPGGGENTLTTRFLLSPSSFLLYLHNARMPALNIEHIAWNVSDPVAMAAW